MKSFTKSKYFYHLLFALIIIIALTNIIFTFTFTKKNYMTDEIWSYGLSNGYYDPFVYSSGDVTTNRVPENYKNMNTWITSDVFWDYIVVNEGEEFSYDSVWYNQSKDIHPPFYYAILHTICSFFPETFSKWFGLSINIMSFLLVTILLYKLCYNMTKSAAFALMTVAFYSFNVAATDTYIYLRMYALVTVFYVALVYFAQKLLIAKKLSFFRNYLPLLCITCLGTLTHYHFAVFAFLISAFVCFYLLFTKKWYKLITFAVTMLFGITFAFLIFPSIPHHIEISMNHSAPSLFRFNFSYIRALLTGYQTGLSFTPYETMFGTYCFLTLIIVILFSLPIWFVFRNENWMKSLLQKIKYTFICFLKNGKALLCSIPPILYITLLAVIAMILFFSKTLVITKLYRTAARYLFPTIAIYYFVFFALLYYIGKAFHFSMKRCKIAFISIIIICSLTSNLLFKTTFGYPDSPYSGKTMDKLEEDSTCIIALSTGWLATAFPFRLLQVGNIYIVDMEYLFVYENELNFLPESAEDTPIYLILDTTNLIPEAQVTDEEVLTVNQLGYVDYNPEYTKEDYLEYFSSLPYVEQFELVGNDAAYYCNLEIYQLR